jgi:GNAT superfamily N-acetyltransferase
MSDSPPAIRRAGPGDLVVIADLHTRSRSDYYHGVVGDDELTDPVAAARRRQWWDEHLRSADHTVFLAEREGLAVGVAVIGRCRFPDPEPRVGSEMHLYVDPGCFRQGVGTSLHATCVRARRAASVALARLWVQDFNLRAQAFYRSQGWQPDGNHRPDSTGLLGYLLRIPPISD